MSRKAGRPQRQSAGGGGRRTLALQLDNQSTLRIDGPAFLDKPLAAHRNSGSVTLNNDLTINQSGSGASLRNLGTITIAAGRTLTINGHQTPYGDQLAWPGMATLANLPATAAPIGKSATGLPIGIQIIGPYLEDRTTLAFARLIEGL